MKSSSPRRVRSVFARGIRPAAIGRPVPVAAAPGDAFRDAQAGVFERLSGFFDAVVQAAIGTDAAGRAAFDGNGLRVSVGPGGERSTAAIDSPRDRRMPILGRRSSVRRSTAAVDSPRDRRLRSGGGRVRGG